MRFALLALVIVAAASAQSPPQSTLPVKLAPQATLPVGPRQWLSPLDYPEGMVPYKPEQWTQEIAVTNNRDRIDHVPIARLKSKWHQSGGMEGIEGAKSDKYKLLPKPPREWIGDIQVLNSLGYMQPNRGMKRLYADGSRFDDVLSVGGVVFEHRVRRKVAGEWKSEVVYEDEKARPKGYAGLNQSCASCHNEAGTGSYSSGLVPGGDTVLSDSLPWRLLGW